MKELLKIIPEYNGRYEISNLGNIYSYYSGKKKKMKTFTDHNGYEIISLSMNGKQKKHIVSRLVAIAFIPNPDNLPEVNHKDGKKHRNIDTNLEWTDRAGNMQHAVENGLTSLNKEVEGTNTQTGETVRYKSMAAAARAIFGHSNCTHISECCRGMRQSCGGYVWAVV